MSNALHKGRYAPVELTSSPQDLARYEALFEANNDPRIDGMLEWRYARNPAGPDSVVLLGVDTESEVEQGVGLYAISATRMRVDGRNVVGAQSLDTLTDANYRKQGIFGWLCRENYDRFQERGGQIVHGFPNANSCWIFENRLDWHMLNPLPFVIRPMKTGYLASRLTERAGLGTVGRALDVRVPIIPGRPNPGIRIAPIEEFGHAHDELWASFSQTIGVCVTRDAAFMQWRLREHPEAAGYHALGAYEGDDLLAEIVWRVEEKHGGIVAYLMEWLCRPGHARAARSLFREAAADMRQRDVDVILAWNDVSFPNASLYAQVGFLPLPEHIRPIELNWGVRVLDPDLVGIATRRESWYISYLDSDTV